MTVSTNTVLNAATLSAVSRSDVEHERLEAAYLPGGSLIAVLLEQHARIRESFSAVRGAGDDSAARQRRFDDLRELLAAHEAGEEMILRPVSRPLAGPDVARERGREEDAITRLLAGLEELEIRDPQFDAGLAALELAVADHTAHEEDDEFPAVQAGCTDEELIRLGGLLAEAETTARTHAAATVAGAGTAHRPVESFAALLDQARGAYKAAREKAAREKAARE